jgi:hypothetical protein
MTPILLLALYSATAADTHAPAPDPAVAPPPAEGSTVEPVAPAPAPVVTAPPAVVMPPAKPVVRLGIFAISMAGVDPALQTAAIDALATAAARVEGYQVVSRSELEQMIGAEKIKDAVGCDDLSCLAEIGAAAGVERVVGGSVSRVENALVVSLQLVNTAYASTENRITLSWKGDLADFPEVLGCAAELLLVPVKDRQPGVLTLAGVPAEAIVSVDGKPVPTGPTGGVEVTGLAVGVHALTVDAPGYAPLDRPFVIRVGQSLQVTPRLDQVATSPFYTRWWFWTGAGVVAAGGVLVALGLGGQGPLGNSIAMNKGTYTFASTVPGASGVGP